MGSDRDYARKPRQSSTARCRETGDSNEETRKGAVYDMWQQAGGKLRQLAGIIRLGSGEFMTAWSLAVYINSIAEAGKAVYDLPMYINVWSSGKTGGRSPVKLIVRRRRAQSAGYL